MLSGNRNENIKGKLDIKNFKKCFIYIYTIELELN